MTGAPDVAVACGNMLGESATWSEREQTLYWVDIRAPALHRLVPSTGVHTTLPLPTLCGGVVPALEGVILALGCEVFRCDVDTGELRLLCGVEPDGTGNRLNELKCDRAGRLWVGSMRDFAVATTGSLYRVGADLRPRRMLRDITIPNSLGWSPDGRTMYFADTALGAIRAFAYDPDNGALGASRDLVAADALPGRPDGCAVDEQGHVWTTRVGAGLVIRLAPDGKVSGQVQLPTEQPTSCALGGPGLMTLYVTTARQSLLPAQLGLQPGAGHLFAAAVDVPGLPDVAFAVQREREPAADAVCA